MKEVSIANVRAHNISPYFSSAYSSNNDALLDINNRITRNESGQGLSWLEILCDDFGHRKVGSTALEDAIDWILKTSRAEGLSAHTEPVTGIPNWVRRHDRAFVLKPRIHRLNVLAIDGSPPGTVEGEVVLLRHYDEIPTANVSGKIVVFSQDWKGYSRTAKYRKSAEKLEKRGAIAVLVSSVTPNSLYTAHTGAGARGSKIPAASIPPEEAQMIGRWLKRGISVRVRLDITSTNLPEPTSSRNVILELKGTELEKEVVLLAAHVDTWDVGQGALDDGGGMAAIRQTLLAIKRYIDESPQNRLKRTIRGVFFTAEEQGNFGAKQYFADHRNTSEKFVFGVETDQGAFRPKNYNSRFEFTGKENQKSPMSKVVNDLNDLGYPISLKDSPSQGQLKYLADTGVPTSIYVSDRGDDFYFQFHHSNADYSSVFEAEDIDQTAAMLAIVALRFANQ
ncbi:unnamed protein product [Caenorhabditis auriculariae]|uniref:Carboxypeptidase Q n=1 Tax=Caenorhabditis auriculariae TaxID=2777116 RepID=A0A8S1H9N7_9PELO|nr:unnamed protein product [Caenorhabditis auriculariae]